MHCRILSKSGLEPKSKTSHVVVSLICEVLGNLRKIFKKLVQVLIAYLISLCHSDINHILSTGINTTGTTNFSQFQ